jgi:uncharacterized membrane protein (DUF4010 family)
MSGVGAGLGTTVNIAWSLSERSLGDAEYLAAMRTIVLPLIKVKKILLDPEHKPII